MKYAAFIVTHGRADRVYTAETLRKCGYTGEIFLVVDDEDKELPKYKDLYRDKVLVFNKSSMRGKFDLADNLPKTNTVTFARNAIWDLVKNQGYQFFIMLDDDYKSFRYMFDENRIFQSTRKVCKKLDEVFNIYFEYLKKAPSIKCLSCAQEGDFIGGPKGGFSDIMTKRKIMNVFFCDTDRQFEILGRMNDDVSTYLKHGNTGDIFLTANYLCVAQLPTQQNAGGLSEMYLENGTFIKSFYSVMFMPSSVTCRTMGKFKRIHHFIDWKSTVPKILREEHKANG